MHISERFAGTLVPGFRVKHGYPKGKGLSSTASSFFDVHLELTVITVLIFR